MSGHSHSSNVASKKNAVNAKKSALYRNVKTATSLVWQMQVKIP